MSLYLTGEARIVEKREVNTQNGDNWTEVKMNVEHEKGYYQLLLTKSLNSQENIDYLDSLKGKKIKVSVFVTSNKDYLKYYMAELPKAV
ncbi:hypothetical protein AB4370_21995 [Vibrio cyclitrophicus]